MRLSLDTLTPRCFLLFCHNARIWQTDGQTDSFLMARPRCMQCSSLWHHDAFSCFVTMHAFDRQMDRQTAFSWLDRDACNARHFDTTMLLVPSSCRSTVTVHFLWLQHGHGIVCHHRPWHHLTTDITGHKNSPETECLQQLIAAECIKKAQRSETGNMTSTSSKLPICWGWSRRHFRAGHFLLQCQLCFSLKPSYIVHCQSVVLILPAPCLTVCPQHGLSQP